MGYSKKVTSKQNQKNKEEEKKKIEKSIFFKKLSTFR